MVTIVGWCGEVTVGTSGEFLDLGRMMIMKMNPNQQSLFTAINVTLITPAFYISVSAPRPQGGELRLLTLFTLQ